MSAYDELRRLDRAKQWAWDQHDEACAWLAQARQDRDPYIVMVATATVEVTRDNAQWAASQLADAREALGLDVPASLAAFGEELADAVVGSG